jgi:UDP-N-acetylmuramate dehydrogenase
MNDNITIKKNLLDHLGELGTVRINEPMSSYTTFKTGGPADILVIPRHAKLAGEVIRAAAGESIPVTVIGGGSNLLVGDRGVRGLVIVLCEKFSGPGRIGIGDDGLVYADAPVLKERFIDFVLEKGLGGVEFMTGIPGCIGGGIVMNAGTNLGSFIDVLVHVEYVDAAGQFHAMEVNRGMSDYRTFRIEKGTLILGGSFRLPISDDPHLLKQRIADILEDRRGKHPLEFPSAGSVFKNPAGHSSWQLVDGAGLKGKSIGGAMVSEKHTNFVINRGNASSKDIKTLIESIQETVLTRYAVSLETEIRMIGEF